MLDDGDAQPSNEKVGFFLNTEFSFFHLFVHLVLSMEKCLSMSGHFTLHRLLLLANAIMTRIFLRRQRFPHQSLRTRHPFPLLKYRSSAVIPQRFQTVVLYGTVLAAITTLIF
jgi:hypothetical protein